MAFQTKEKIKNTNIDSFHPCFIAVPKSSGCTNNRFTRKNQNNTLNYAPSKLISSFIHPTIHIVPLYLNHPLIHFSKDGMHFSFYGNHMFACHLTHMFEFFTRKLIVYIYIQATNSLLYLYPIHMCEQAHYSNHSNHLRGGVSYVTHAPFLSTLSLAELTLGELP